MPLGHTSKGTIDSTYAEVSEYMEANGYLSKAQSCLALFFAISQADEVEGIGDFFSGRNLPIAEAYHDLEASLSILRLGFNKQAFSSLRMGRDNGILSAYWRARGDKTEEFRRWISARHPTPWKKAEIRAPIMALEGVEDFFEEFHLRTTTEQLDELDKYVHTSGFRFSTLGEEQRQLRAENRFVDCDQWYEFFRATARLVVCLKLLVSPKLAIVVPDNFFMRKFGSYNRAPFCGVLFGDYSGAIEACVGKDEYRALAKRAENTQEVKDVRSYLRGFPDLSDEEVRGRQREFWESFGFDEEAIQCRVKDVMESLTGSGSA
ncbi:MAG: hypothetical protein OXG74_15775 [Acidobacteria bacterium]|nr:hypothetical protein [Acidobacteriota bacterium]